MADSQGACNSSGPYRQLPSTAQPRTGLWQTLPPEIRTNILKEIAKQKLPGWASAAVVCKEWQSVIAMINLRKLRLQESHLDGFWDNLVL